jgi:arylsulfatase A-like enzyme
MRFSQTGVNLRRQFPIICVALSWALAAFAGAAALPARPNVVLVLADQWRAEAFGFAGNPDVQTPHLDRLAREGLRFDHAIAGLPVCCPARASLMTGQRPLTHGVFMNDTPLSTNAVTLAKALRDAGYDTAYIGKWHLDGHGRSSFIPRERRQGFDYWKVLECTHNYTNSFYYADGPEKLKWEGYDAIAQTRDAQQYLRDHTRSAKPFFLFLAWGPPHDPYQTAPAKYRARYDPVKLHLRPNVPRELASKARNDLAGYYAHCTALDDCLGGLRATLQETGLEPNTLLVFTSDHGDLLGAHGGSNKQQPYDESIRVPLLWRWPAGLSAEPRVFDALFGSEDFMPTILGLCGVAIPAAVEGLDFSGYLRGGANPSDGIAQISCVAPFGQWARRVGGKEYRGIRTSRFTYVRDLNGPWLLFDNRNDPWQLTNLVNQPGHTRLQAELEAALKDKLRAARDDFLPADRYLQKWGYTVDATGTVPYTP